MNTSKISMLENDEIVRQLYMQYIKKMDIGMKWSVEAFEEKIPAIMFKQLSTATKVQENIAGGYTAELPFVIIFRGFAKDTNDLLNLAKPLNDLARTFEEETYNNFPNIKLTGVTPVTLEMTSTPSLDSDVEDNVADYMATYVLKYKKKGRFE